MENPAGGVDLILDGRAAAARPAPGDADKFQGTRL